MAFTANALEPDDWQDEADLPVVVSFPPQAPNRSWVLAPSNEEVAGLRKHIAVKETAAKMLNERIRKLTAEGAAKDKHLAEFEAQLLALREDLAHRENENRSLQTSLDLSVVEGARLSGRLWDSGVEGDTLRVRLDTLKATLLASEAERDRLKAALQETTSLHRVEVDAFNSQLGAMAAHAAAAEAMLAETRKSLAACTEESIEARRKAAEVIRERDAAAKLVGELQGRLKARDRQVYELDGSRAKLMAQTAGLLEAFEARSAALAGAEARAGALAEQVSHFESKSILAQRQVESLTAKLQSQEPALAKAAETVQSLAKGVADAEAKSRSAQSETERLIIKMRSHEAALAEASDSIQMLAGRAAAAEANARVTQGEARDLHKKIGGHDTALAEAAESIKSLTARAAAAEAGAHEAGSRIERLSLELQQEQARRAIAEVACARVETEAVRLRRQIETLTRRNHELEDVRQHEAIAPTAPERAAPAASDAVTVPAAALTSALPSARLLLADTISL